MLPQSFTSCLEHKEEHRASDGRLVWDSCEDVVVVTSV